MSSRELVEWELLERIDPWGQRRDDWRAALNAWLDYLRTRSKDAPELSPEQFMLDFMNEHQPNQQQSIDKQLEMVAHINAMLGGVDLRGERE